VAEKVVGGMFVPNPIGLEVSEPHLHWKHQGVDFATMSHSSQVCLISFILL